MTEQKNNNSFLHKQGKLLYIIAFAVCATWALSATIHSMQAQANSTQTQVVGLKEQQEAFVSKELFNAHLVLWDKRFQIMEKQLTRIERLLLEQQKK